MCEHKSVSAAAAYANNLWHKHLYYVISIQWYILTPLSSHNISKLSKYYDTIKESCHTFLTEGTVNGTL